MAAKTTGATPGSCFPGIAPVVSSSLEPDAGGDERSIRPRHAVHLDRVTDLEIGRLEGATMALHARAAVHREKLRLDGQAGRGDGRDRAPHLDLRRRRRSPQAGEFAGEGRRLRGARCLCVDEVAASWGCYAVSA